jgi:hypothetical protein
LKITEHEMLVTLATMALKMEDLTDEDVLDAFRQLGYGHVVSEARESEKIPTPLREPLAWFSQRMEEKLQANDHKGHWSNCTMTYLRNRINEELKELELALNGDHPLGYTSAEAHRIVLEAADVANFALMIADNVRSKID